MASSKKWIALIRGIGPSTHKKMSMEVLRESCKVSGLDAVSTYIASGNLLFESAKPKAALMQILTKVLHSYDLENAVILRTPAELKKVVLANPHPQAALKRPSHCLVVFYNHKVDLNSTDKLKQWPGPESISSLSREICVDYIDGVGTSKLTPAVLDREVGQPGTARNWNTINRLIALTER
ncbi:DUF1697 domain-containing protein [Granulosicoccus sp.]|nr:DUF1697 domain-containing protein [Granulosicoccus sp.]MDB4224821.1 DUF1697 domain-containing protein [Granulosicoccus sp.]